MNSLNILDVVVNDPISIGDGIISLFIVIAVFSIPVLITIFIIAAISKNGKKKNAQTLNSNKENIDDK